MPSLNIYSDHSDHQQLDLVGTLITAGRSSTNDIVIADGAASRAHFELQRRDRQWFIKDLGSRNGTLVNGVRVTTQTALRTGDEISVGHTRLVYEDEAPAPPPPMRDSAAANTLMFHAQDLASSFSSDDATIGEQPRIEDLSLVNWMAHELMSVSQEQELTDLVTRLLLEVLDADRCAIIYDPAGDGSAITLQSVACARQDQSRTVSVSSSVARHVIQEKMALHSSNLLADDRFMHQHSIMGGQITSILCAPLWAAEKVFGLVYVDTLGRLGDLGKPQLALLCAVANLAAVKIENLRLFAASIAKARMEQELSLAAQIQAKMLGASSFEHEDVVCVGFTRPCFEVGGDYYDFGLTSQGNMTVTVADVSGKGASGALLMASCKSMLSALIDVGVVLAERVERLNRHIRANSTVNRFMTFFHAQLDSREDVLRYCNAGHNPPLVLGPDGKLATLGATSTVLGIIDTDFPVATTPFPPGSLLVAYSDGVTEAHNSAGQEYGEQRLAELLREAGHLTPDQLRDALLEDLESFLGGPPTEDDVTIVIVQRV